MKYLVLFFLLQSLIGRDLYAQTTIDPSSITLGIDQINMVNGDTILHWGKTRSAFRGGYYNSSEITNAKTGALSFAYGFSNIAKGDFSISMGIANNSEAFETITLGKENQALFSNAIGIGRKNIVTSRDGIALGNYLLVNNQDAIALGAYNIDMPVPPEQDDKPIFTLGNGDGRDKGRSNAITVLYDGRMSLRTPTPFADLHLMHKNNSSDSGFRIENEAGTGPGKYWRFYVRSMNDELALYNHTSSSAVGEFNGAGVYSNLSDRRHKKNIIDLPYGLEEVLKLSPKKYQFKHINDTEDIGLIAQDVLKIIPEIVNYNQEDDTYKMNYNGFGVLAIKAIQELHDIVQEQNKLIDVLMKKVEELTLSQE